MDTDVIFVGKRKLTAIVMDDKPKTKESKDG